MPTTTIEHLRTRIVGSGGVVLRDSITVSGCVISSDADDNFYRTFIVDDGTGAVELMAGLYGLDRLYPLGTRVMLHLRGCYADYGYGVLQVGRKAEAYESYGVDYLGSREALDRVVERGSEVEAIVAEHRFISELSEADLGRLVHIRSLHLVDSSSIDTLLGDTLDDAVWRGYALFKSDNGDSIAVYTRNYATFAGHPIPRGELSISGILQWGKYDGRRECYQLKMRYEQDCIYR